MKKICYILVFALIFAMSTSCSALSALNKSVKYHFQSEKASQKGEVSRIVFSNEDKLVVDTLRRPAVYINH